MEVDKSYGKLLLGVQGCAASSASALVCVWALLPHPRSVKLGTDAASTGQTVVFHLISHYQGSQMNYITYMSSKDPQLDGGTLHLTGPGVGHQ